MTITNKPSKVSLTLRVVAALYLFYLAYGLMKDSGASENRTVAVIAAAVFVVCGALFLITSLRRLLTGNYDGGGGAGEPALPERDEQTPDVPESAAQREEEQSE